MQNIWMPTPCESDEKKKELQLDNIMLMIESYVPDAIPEVKEAIRESLRSAGKRTRIQAGHDKSDRCRPQKQRKKSHDHRKDGDDDASDGVGPKSTTRGSRSKAGNTRKLKV